jgi:hypothetical protein
MHTYKGGKTEMIYKKCDACAANLDPGERCDCKDAQDKIDRMAKRCQLKIEEMQEAAGDDYNADGAKLEILNFLDDCDVEHQNVDEIIAQLEF